MTAKNTSLASELDYLNLLVPSLLVRSPNFLVPSPKPKSRETAKLTRQLVVKHAHAYVAALPYDERTRITVANWDVRARPMNGGVKETNRWGAATWRIERTPSYDIAVTRDMEALDFDALQWFDWTKSRFMYLMFSLDVGQSRTLHVAPELRGKHIYPTQCSALTNARTHLLQTHQQRFNIDYDFHNETLTIKHIPFDSSAYRAPRSRAPETFRPDRPDRSQP
jgi:hypothetical protein